MAQRFTKEMVAHFRSRLQEQKAKQRNMERHNESQALNELSLETTDEISHLRTHSADLGTNESEQDLTLEIDDAFIRLENGTYGTCTNCSCDIPLSRLEALPATHLCGPCESRAEKENKQHRHELRV